MNSWQLWAAGAAVLAAVTAVLAKLGVTGIDSNLATFLRTVVVAIALLLVLILTGQWPQHPLQDLPKRSVVALVGSGLATGLSWLCYFQALKLGPVSRVAPIDKLSVVLVAIFGVVVLGEKLSTAAWLGVLLMGAGAVLVALA